ncbi:MAG: glycosyltransferase [Clostridiales Family XIII bacterium]|nr:glycosyltransferase [Clostridiales Family XIII bacterium]
MPVYNIEQYLEKCIGSICAQTYRNLEIILVDDGSTDGSGAVCDRFAGRDSRIKVIHKPNGGIADARNTGISAASGECIGFVDGDDAISERMYAHLLDVMKSNDADISVCGYKNTQSDEGDGQSGAAHPSPEPAFPSRDAHMVLSGHEAILGIMNGRAHEENEQGSATGFTKRALRIFSPTAGTVSPYVWNKLYRKSLVVNLRNGKQLRFEHVFMEDILFNARVFMLADRVALSPEPYYYYLIDRVGSLTRRYTQESIEARVNCLNGYREVLSDFTAPEKRQVMNNLLRHYLICYYHCISATEPEGDGWDALKDRTRNAIGEIMKYAKQYRIMTSLRVMAFMMRNMSGLVTFGSKSVRKIYRRK